MCFAQFYPIGRIGFKVNITPRKGRNKPYITLFFSVIHLVRKFALFGCQKCRRMGDTLEKRSYYTLKILEKRMI